MDLGMKDVYYSDLELPALLLLLLLLLQFGCIVQICEHSVRLFRQSSLQARDWVEKCEEVSQGTFQPKRQNDILSAALGKNEHPGYVRGVGVYVTIRDVFGKPESTTRGKSAGVVSMADLEEIMEKKVYDKLADKIRKESQMEMQSKIDMMQSQLEYLMKNAQHSPVVGTTQSGHMHFDPPPTRSSCHSIDPLIKMQEDAKPKVMDFETGDLLQPPIVTDDELMYLGDESKKLVAHLRNLPPGLDYIDLDFEPTIFHHSDVENIPVMLTDIQDLFTMRWLNVTIIQVFMICLHRLCKKIGVSSIGFVCPRKISKANVLKNSNSVTQYLIHAMVQEKAWRYVLAPYHQDNHWLLLVICVSSKKVYVLDPLPCERDIDLKTTLNMAFRSSTNLRGQRARNNVDWNHIKCPRQPGGVECGYYVMRYMYEICTPYYEFDSLDKAFEESSYSIKEVDEIRDIWAKYFCEECL